MEKTKTAKHEVRLRAIPDLVDATEWVYNGQRNGTIDSARASGLNQTLKGARAIIVDLPLALAKLQVQAAIRKVELQVPPQLMSISGSVAPASQD